MKNVLLLACLCVLPFDCRANLGETLAQSIERYGPVLQQTQTPHLPAGEAAILYEFSKNGFRIQVRFVGAKAAWMTYLKESGPIFETEIKTLLDNNAEGSTWTPGLEVKDRIMKRHISYNRADNLADAKYQELGTYHGLAIITKAWRLATSQASGL